MALAAAAELAGAGTGTVVTDLLFLDALFFLALEALEGAAELAEAGAAAELAEAGAAAELAAGAAVPAAADDLFPILWRCAKRFARNPRKKGTKTDDIPQWLAHPIRRFYADFASMDWCPRPPPRYRYYAHD